MDECNDVVWVLPVIHIRAVPPAHMKIDRGRDLEDKKTKSTPDICRGEKKQGGARYPKAEVFPPSIDCVHESYFSVKRGRVRRSAKKPDKPTSDAKARRQIWHLRPAAHPQEAKEEAGEDDLAAETHPEPGRNDDAHHAERVQVAEGGVFPKEYGPDRSTQTEQE